MADHLISGRINVNGKEALELGAGLGIPGILSVMMGARKVRKVTATHSFLNIIIDHHYRVSRQSHRGCS